MGGYVMTNSNGNDNVYGNDRERKEVKNERIKEVLSKIKPLEQSGMKKVQERLDILTKPPGSLGRMEELAVQLGGICGGFFPVNSIKKVVVMAADHGVTKEGISAFPGEVTAQMVANFVNGGAGINVLCRLAGAEVRVIDMGVAADIDLPGVTNRKFRKGTGNFATEKAMGYEEAEKAVLAGIEVAEEEVLNGTQILATGEMGIGNTTASSAVMAALTGYEAANVVGRGTGLNDRQLALKVQVVEKAIAMHQPDAGDALDVLSKVGGLEIAGLAGMIIGAAAHRCPVIIDGFISTVAALAAVKLNPLVLNYLIPSHLSQEPGHNLLLEYLELKPYLNMNMRLGEGTGAALAMNIVEGTARILQEMATFSEAGVSDKGEDKTDQDIPCAARDDRS